MIEADLVKYMHCMLVLEKQEETTKYDMRNIWIYLRRCQAWLRDSDALEESLNDFEAQNRTIRNMYESTLRQQEAIMSKYSELLV